jgi:hypothetical protein
VRAVASGMLGVSVLAQLGGRSPAPPRRGSLQKPTNPGTDANPFARPFTSVPLAIDARERRVVGVMVAKGIGGDEPLPMGSDYHAPSHPPGGIVITPGDECHGAMMS